MNGVRDAKNKPLSQKPHNIKAKTGSPLPARRLRVLVASHSHPKVTNGGAEIAAFRLFAEFDAHDDVEAWFLGCNTQAGAGRDGVALTQPFTDREYVYSTTGQFDWFRMANADLRLPSELEALLQELKPDIIHLHHYVVFGVEVIWTIKRVLPHAKIIVTLHEYLAICNHFGQMVKTGKFNLCDKSGLDECHKCFPTIPVSDFFIRDKYLRIFFQHVDHFISPSYFLLNRYTAWGLDKARLTMIENIIAPVISTSKPFLENNDGTAPLRIGFFGQISKLKGIGVLMEAAAILSKIKDINISFEIYGDYRGQPKEFQKEFLEQLEEATSNVNYHGPYRQDQVDGLMRGVDAVIVPSIWWENSPVVIQEALRNTRPVICSDIGGMAEKVQDGIDGFHFSVGSGLSLSSLLQRLYGERYALLNIRSTLTPPLQVKAVVEAHISVYENVLKPFV